jgi:hypothetical protein
MAIGRLVGDQDIRLELVQTVVVIGKITATLIASTPT